MNSFMKKASWSPYVVGAGIGTLSWVAFLFMGKVIGSSTVFVYLAGMIEKIFAPGCVANSVYFNKYLVGKPVFNWYFALVVMVFFGALVSSYLGNSRTKESVPSIWAQRFGDSKVIRYFWSLIGGILLGFGARLAGGCTSGHSISGGLMLAVSSWVFTAVLFVVGVVAAMLIYRR